jgi:hypothetical protein
VWESFSSPGGGVNTSLFQTSELGYFYAGLFCSGRTQLCFKKFLFLDHCFTRLIKEIKVTSL